MKKAFGLILLFFLAIDTAFALRCGTDLVLEGDRKIDVLKICGPPDFKEERVVYEVVKIRHPGGGLALEKYVPVTIEEWTYNLGSHRLMRLLRFKDGVLKEIETLGYGYQK